MPINFGVPKMQKDNYKFKVGDNKIRVLAMSDDWLISHFTKTGSIPCLNDIFGNGDCEKCQEKGDDGKKKNNPSAKKIAYLWDYDLDKIVMAFISKGVINELQTLSETEDYNYNELPMPYDVIIKYDDKAAPKDMYKVIPGRANKEVPQGTMDELGKKKPLDQIVESIRAKNSIAKVEEPADEPLHHEGQEDIDPETGQPFVF